MFAIRTVEVRGAPPAVAAQARAALGSFEGTNLLGLDGSAVVRRLEDLPTVVSATYDRAFPNTLRVKIVAEQPVAVLRSGVSSWLISARARVIRVVDRSQYRTLPRIWVPPGVTADTGSFLDGDAGAAARALRAFVTSGFARRMTWARLHGGQLTLGMRSGLELRLGAPTDLALKIAVVRGIVRTLTLPAQGGPTYLDVSLPERPVSGSNPQPASGG